MKTKSAPLTRRRAAFVIGCAAIMLAGCDVPCGIYCYPALGDAGGKAGDLAEFLAVERADEIAGGNVILGQAGPLGGKGHMALALRANRISRTIPGVEGITVRTSGAAASRFPTSTGSATALTADIALPLWKGMSSGTSHIGGLDLTGSLSVLQGFPENSLHLTSNGNFAPGFGLRIGLVEETPRLPGISFATSFRFLPSFGFRPDTMTVVGGGTMKVGGESIDLDVTSWRLAASKRFRNLGVTLGVGGDGYDGSSTVTAALSSPVLPANSGSQYISFSTQRRNLFAGLSYTVGSATLVAEYGHLSLTGDSYIHAINTFGGQSADRSRDYLSLGVRLGIGQ